MVRLLRFDLDFWDYATFATIFLAAAEDVSVSQLQAALLAR